MQMLEIDRAHAAGARRFTTLAFTQFKRFVRADMKELAGKQFVPISLYQSIA
jgi:hypothetical protein